MKYRIIVEAEIEAYDKFFAILKLSEILENVDMYGVDIQENYDEILSLKIEEIDKFSTKNVENSRKLPEKLRFLAKTHEIFVKILENLTKIRTKCRKFTKIRRKFQ